ncbi:MAG: DUF1294 domain-containing protein [Alphaproteobacteria bacterium]|nr:DUF1294 domain-containing protein [Alphaproteobacteria bacterium]
MVLTFVAIMLGCFFILRPLQKNAFYMIYFALQTGLAYFFEYYKGLHYPIFSKAALMVFLACHFVVINLVTFLAYGVDKKAAKTKSWRVPELQLHLLEFLGGSPAAFMAQKIFRHKTKKKSYQISFIFVLAVQIAIIYYVLKSLRLM